MKRIRVKFCGYERYMLENNVVLDALKEMYDVELSDNPDIVFYSMFDRSYQKYKCIRVIVTGEASIPDFNKVDYAISSARLDFSGRHLYYPYYFMTGVSKYKHQIGLDYPGGGAKVLQFYIFTHCITGGRSA